MTYDYPVRKYIPDYDVEDISKRYKKLYTALVYDILESEYKLTGRALEGGIYPLSPEMKVAGPAFTVHGIVVPNVEKNKELDLINLGMIKSMIKGCVQLRGTQNSSNCAHFGEMNAVAAKAAGCDGVVVDGATRDSNFIMQMNYPVFCRFRTPVEGKSRFVNMDYQIPIFLKGTDGNILVYPGDYIFGDNDGVVIVPRDLVVQVLEAAEQLNSRESLSRQKIAEGEDPLEIYLKVGEF